MSGGQAPPTRGLATSPGLLRRLACLAYEGILLFGVLMIAGIAYAVLTQQRHALEGKTGLQVFLFLLLGIYFTWFWSKGGQTLAMKTWHLRVVRTDGRPLTQRRALVRYLLSWMWFVPALVIAAAAGLRTSSSMAGVLAVGMLAYAGVAGLRRDRRLWHDLACDTCVIDCRPPATVADGSR